MALDALLFDLDGTLIDTNAMHIQAWQRVFASHGYKVDPDRIAREIGKGGDMLVPAVLGAAANDSIGNALGKAQPKAFEALARERGIQVFRNAAELVRTVRARGLRTALVTSSGGDTIELVEELTELNFKNLFDVLVTADDAERSKPAPDLIHATIQKLRLSPAQVAIVGDTPFDAEAARHSGATFLGVTCGKLFSREQLMAAGARGVWSDPADMLQHLDDALHLASPGAARLSNDVMEKLMRVALETAQDAIEAGEVPIACVLARGDGEVIARAFNRMNATQDKTAHAEIVAFQQAAGKCPIDCRDLILVSTLEPCVMCTGAAMEASVDTIIFALPAPADNGRSRVAPPRSPEAQMPRFVGEILKRESRALIKKWLKHNADTPQAAFVRQLLSANL